MAMATGRRDAVITPPDFPSKAAVLKTEKSLMVLWFRLLAYTVYTPREGEKDRGIPTSSGSSSEAAVQMSGMGWMKS